MYIVLAIIAFGVLIAVHEGGHFLAARAFDVKVNEFALGMGPALVKKQRKETLYSLRALPFGGYCAMEGEDAETGDPRAFTAKPAWQRAVILVAGAAMNYLIGLVLIFCIAPNAAFSEPVIAAFMDGCPYESADGLQVGDRIVRIDGRRIFFADNVATYMTRTGSDVHTIVLRRDGKRVVLKDYAMPKVEYTQSDGSTVMKYGLYFAPRQDGLAANLRYTWYEGMEFVRIIWRSLGDLFTGAVGIRDLSGPVGIVGYVNEVETAAETPLEARFSFCYIFALIAVNLAVMNLLPIPALDGGRVFLLLVTWCIERVTRKKLNPKFEAVIHTAGFVLLMCLMVFVMFNDVVKLIVK